MVAAMSALPRPARVLLAGLVGGALAGVLLALAATPAHRATATVVVGPALRTAGAQLDTTTATVAALVGSSAVLDNVTDALHRPRGGLAGSVHAHPRHGTALVEITVDQPSAIDAERVAQQILVVLPALAGSRLPHAGSSAVLTVDTPGGSARVLGRPFVRNGVLGGLAGLLLALVVLGGKTVQLPRPQRRESDAPVAPVRPAAAPTVVKPAQPPAPTAAPTLPPPPPLPAVPGAARRGSFAELERIAAAETDEGRRRSSSSTWSSCASTCKRTGRCRRISPRLSSTSSGATAAHDRQRPLDGAIVRVQPEGGLERALRVALPAGVVVDRAEQVVHGERPRRPPFGLQQRGQCGRRCARDLGLADPGVDRHGIEAVRPTKVGGAAVGHAAVDELRRQPGWRERDQGEGHRQARRDSPRARRDQRAAVVREPDPGEQEEEDRESREGEGPVDQGLREEQRAARERGGRRGAPAPGAAREADEQQPVRACGEHEADDPLLAEQLEGQGMGAGRLLGTAAVGEVGGAEAAGAVARTGWPRHSSIATRQKS